MEENMLMIRDPKSLFFNFDWPKNVDENLNGEIKFIIKINELLVGNKIKNKIEQLLFKYMETVFMNTENSKSNEPHIFVLNLSQILELRSSNEHVALQNIYLLHKEKYKKTV